MGYKRIFFFDMDKTAIEMDGYDFPYIVGQTLKGKTGKDYSRDEVYRVLGIFGMDYHMSIEKMRHETGIDDHDSFFSDLEANDYEGRIPMIGDGIHMRDDVRALLENLRRDNRNRIEIVTNAPESITMMQLNRLRAGKLFHEVHPSRYFTIDSKPRPNSLNSSMKKHGVPPECSWIFGDMRFDIMAGKAAGINTGLKAISDGKYDGPKPDLEDTCLVRLVDRALEAGR